MSNFTTEQLEAYNRVALEIGQYYATVEGARNEGREEGEAIGLEKGKIEMAKAMLEDGEITEKIVKYSGLTIDQIQSLK